MGGDDKKRDSLPIGPGKKNIVEEKIDEDDIEVIEVYISKDHLQCEDESGKTLSVTERMLQQVGVKSYSSECGVITGVMPPALCGTTTLRINVHGIDERKLPEAEVIGFKSVETFEGKQDYEIVSCD
tara:strand:+ start:369 stop:749 length:381 start_codon:yes stop_codon:yes gene_type:complete